MGINPGMLIFGLFDGGLAFMIVFWLLKARFRNKTIGRVFGTILGTIVFSIYIALFVCFNTPGIWVSPDFKILIYLAPIVLFVLLTILVLLSQPPKKKNEEDTEDNPDENAENNTAGES